MGWNDYGKKGQPGSGAASEFVREGNVDLFMFTTERTRVRFLTEDLSVEQLMAERGLSREEADDLLYTKLSKDRWVIPMSFWEHRIKEIPNKRFFSTVVCRGRGKCPLCDDNDAAKQNGVAENKFLPYPVSRKFVVPAWVYPLNRVLFVRAAEKFFDSVADYLNANGPNSDFEIFKVGKGLDTEYKSIFCGVGQPLEVDRSSFPAPSSVDLWPGDAEFKRRLEGGRAPQPAQQSAAPQAQRPAQQAQQAPVAQPAAKAAPVVTPEEKASAADVVTGEFKLPFGQFKGMTFDQVFKAGNGDYIKFLADNSAGQVQAAARQFLGLA